MALVGSLAGFGLGDPSLTGTPVPAPKLPVPRPRPRPLGKSHGSARPSTSPGPLGAGPTSGMFVAASSGGLGVVRRPSLFQRHSSRTFSLFGADGSGENDNENGTGDDSKVGTGEGEEDDANGGTRTPVASQTRRARATTIVASSSPVSLRRAGTVVVGLSSSRRARSPGGEDTDEHQHRSSWIQGRRRASAGGAAAPLGVTLTSGLDGADGARFLGAGDEDPQPRSPTPYPGQRPRSRVHSSAFGRSKSRPTSSGGASSSGTSNSTSSGGTIGGSLSTRIGALFHFNKGRRGSTAGRERGDDEGTGERPSHRGDDEGYVGVYSGAIYHDGGRASKCQIDVDNALSPTSTNEQPSSPSPAPVHGGPFTATHSRLLELFPPPFCPSDSPPACVQPWCPHIDLESVSPHLSPDDVNTRALDDFIDGETHDPATRETSAGEDDHDLLQGPPLSRRSPRNPAPASIESSDLPSSSPEHEEENSEPSPCHHHEQPDPPPPGSPLGEGEEPEATEEDELLPPPAMLSSSQQASSVSASGHPTYPYAHLYPQGQPSTLGVRQSPPQPHSHHGHTYASGSGEGEGSRSGMRLVGAAKVQREVGQGPATKANLKAWWNQINFVKGIKKDVREDADMPTLSSLTRSLTLPLNRKRTTKPQSPSAVVTPTDERPDLDLTPPALEFSASTPPALPRRQNSFLGIKTSAINNNGGIFNLNLDGLMNSKSSPATKPDAFVVPAYVAPDSTSSQNVVFGRPLRDSLKYASVQISTAGADGKLFVWGFIPVVVAKCGLYLKENATEVPGTFRVNGSNRRMRELQAVFETPPRYGKNLDWKQESYTTHDVASVFRRYLTQMPEPVIPYDLYHQFRDALGQEPFDQDEAIAKFKALIRQLPRANQYLLLYVLDLLSVFARKSDKNLMTASNLAVIFRPGLMSHPEHEMLPQEHALSQKVLEFLIAHQDWFMLDIPPPTTGGGRRGSAAQAHGTPQAQSPSQPHSTPTGMQQHDRQPSDTAVPTLPPPPGPQQFVYGTGSAPTTPTRNQSFQQQQQESVLGAAGSSPRAAHAATANVSSGSRGAVVAGGAPSSSPHPHSSSSPPSHPPTAFRAPNGGASSPNDSVMEEESDIGGGGWKLVSKGSDATGTAANGAAVLEKTERERKVIRRRTTVERSDVKRGSALEEGDMTPMRDAGRPTSMISGLSGATVQRSRTLPSSRRKENHSSSSTSSHEHRGASELGHRQGPSNHSGSAVQFADGTAGDRPGRREQAQGKEKERRSVLLKKRRASSSGPGGEQQRRTLF